MKNPRAEHNFVGRTCSITGVGSYVPEKVLTNADLEKMVETSDEWITTRTGIKERRIAAANEFTSDLAAKAAFRAMEMAGVTALQIDLIIVASITPDMPFPNTACVVQQKIGARRVPAFDIEAACSGFLYALEVGQNFITARTFETVLVIGAEKLSQWVDWTDRSTAIIFADGAGAVVVGPVADPADGPGIGPVVWGSAGDMADKIYIKDRDSFIVQEGQAVFRWATTALHPVARRACEVAGVDPGELAAFVPHQANLRIIEAIARKIGAPQAKVADDIVTAGNTSSASIPLALARMIERGEVGSGAPVLLIGFGAGICYAAQVIILP